jgi:hypothetical protein
MRRFNAHTASPAKGLLCRTIRSNDTTETHRAWCHFYWGWRGRFTATCRRYCRFSAGANGWPFDPGQPKCVAALRHVCMANEPFRHNSKIRRERARSKNAPLLRGRAGKKMVAPLLTYRRRTRAGMSLYARRQLPDLYSPWFQSALALAALPVLTSRSGLAWASAKLAVPKTATTTAITLMIFIWSSPVV